MKFLYFDDVPKDEKMNIVEWTLKYSFKTQISNPNKMITGITIEKKKSLENF